MDNESSQGQSRLKDDAASTYRLFEKISWFHSVPRLRQRLVKVNFADYLSHVPIAMERDLVYLISGLNDQLGLSLDPIQHPNLSRELGEYLRLCDSYGLTIYHFLSHAAKSWQEIRPKYQELSRSQLSAALRRCFPNIQNNHADSLAGYLLTQTLARLIPPFPFYEEERTFSIVVVRAQADLPWSLASEPVDYFSTMQTHFPAIEWKGQCSERRHWFVGIRLLSQFSRKTSSVLKNALAGLNYLSTSLVRNRKKLLHVVLFEEGDVSLFKFNLHHYANLAGTFFELFDSSLAEYRKGYPGFSGFIEEEMRHEMTAGEG
jgi:hypothetical protein